MGWQKHDSNSANPLPRLWSRLKYTVAVTVFRLRILESVCKRGRARDKSLWARGGCDSDVASILMASR